MSEWLSKLHEFFTEQEPFVISTVTHFDGNSPDQVGACVLYSETRCLSFVASNQRLEHMLRGSQQSLSTNMPFRVEHLALGEVAGTDNGQCEISYELFLANDYPNWLRTLRANQHIGVNSIWLREIVGVAPAFQIHDTVMAEHVDSEDPNIASFIKQKPPIDCALIKKRDRTQLMRAFYNRQIPLLVVGDHPVITAIDLQAQDLPIAITNLRPQDSATDVLSDKTSGASYLLIMTGDHELDFQYCQIALDNPRWHFVGCLGSTKKADIFKDKLKQNGATQIQLDKLHMPVGLPDISGKQSSVIALSIIAQLMSVATLTDQKTPKHE